MSWETSKDLWEYLIKGYEKKTIFLIHVHMWEHVEGNNMSGHILLLKDLYSRLVIARDEYKVPKHKKGLTLLKSLLESYDTLKSVSLNNDNLIFEIVVDVCFKKKYKWLMQEL